MVEEVSLAEVGSSLRDKLRAHHGLPIPVRSLVDGQLQPMGFGSGCRVLVRGVQSKVMRGWLAAMDVLNRFR